MILQVMTIRDRVADAFDRPSFHTSVGAAARGFGDEINRPESITKNHAEDYDLYHLGTYDDSDASFKLFDKPRQVAIGKDLVRS